MPWSEASTEKLMRIASRQNPVGPSRNNHANVRCARFDPRTRPGSVSDTARPSDCILTAIPVKHQQDESVHIAVPFCAQSGGKVQEGTGPFVHDAMASATQQALFHRSDENSASDTKGHRRVDSIDDILNDLFDNPVAAYTISEPEHGSRPHCQHFLPEPKNFDGSSRLSRRRILLDVQ
jgi:hypothetical protein